MRAWCLVLPAAYSNMLRELIYAVKCCVEAIVWYRAGANVAIELLETDPAYVVAWLVGHAGFSRPVGLN